MLQHLRSASRRLLVLPRHRLRTYGRRAFSVAGPSALWGSKLTPTPKFSSSSEGVVLYQWGLTPPGKLNTVCTLLICIVSTATLHYGHATDDDDDDVFLVNVNVVLCVSVSRCVLA